VKMRIKYHKEFQKWLYIIRLQFIGQNDGLSCHEEKREKDKRNVTTLERCHEKSENLQGFF